MAISKADCQFERSNAVIVILVLTIFNALASSVVLLGFVYFGFPGK